MKRISSLLLEAVAGTATLLAVLIGLSLFIDTMEKDYRIGKAGWSTFSVEA